MKVVKSKYLRANNQRGFLAESLDGPDEVLTESTRMGIATNSVCGHFEIGAIIAKITKGPRKAERAEGHRIEFLLTDHEVDWLLQLLKGYKKDRKPYRAKEAK